MTVSRRFGSWIPERSRFALVECGCPHNLSTVGYNCPSLWLHVSLHTSPFPRKRLVPESYTLIHANVNIKYTPGVSIDKSHPLFRLLLLRDSIHFFFVLLTLIDFPPSSHYIPFCLTFIFPLSFIYLFTPPP